MAPRLAILLASGGTLLVAAYAALAIVQILVLNPLAAAPGRTIEQIRADMAEANEYILTPLVVGMLALGPLIAVTVLLLTIARRDLTPLLVSAAYLALLAFGSVAYFVASFGPGMALADTYFISGADHSPWAQPLFATSAVAFVGLLLVPVAVALRVRHRRAATV
jgi:hypothetical protein